MMTSLDDVIVCDVTLLTSFDEVNVAGYDVIPSDIATDDVIKYCDDVTPVRVFTVADATLPIN